MSDRPFSLRYEGSGGHVINFDAWPYFWNDTNLQSYQWDIQSVNKNIGNGAFVSKISRGLINKSIKLLIWNDSESIGSLTNAMTAVFEEDVISKAPGKLYLNDQYLTGYFTAVEFGNRIRSQYIEATLNFATGSPFWIDETLVRFDPLETTALLGFIMPIKLPLALVAPQIRTLINDHYANSSAIITMYGPVTDPEFYVGNHLYKVTGELILGERIEIDQMAKTVTKITTGGTRINFFGNRNKTESVFDPIPPGENFIYSANDFTFDILLMRERSEPIWT